jgi:6,7-dimethyl-8-ribityllumazine synthase
MPRVIEGGLSAAGLKFAIVSSRFNGLIVDPLVGGAIDAIVRTGGAEADITHYRCPGAYELPQVVRQVALVGHVDAIIALGAVIRGSTPHFDYVAGEAAKGIAQVAAQADIPIAFGVLTTDTIEQALERAGTKAGNKGFDAAMTAIETARLFRLIRDVGRDGRGRSPA